MDAAGETSRLQVVCYGDVRAPHVELPLPQSENSTQHTARVNSWEIKYFRQLILKTSYNKIISVNLSESTFFFSIECLRQTLPLINCELTLEVVEDN